MANMYPSVPLGQQRLAELVAKSMLEKANESRDKRYRFSKKRKKKKIAEEFDTDLDLDIVPYVKTDAEKMASEATTVIVRSKGEDHTNFYNL